jgi:hypothetical protein
MRACTSQPCCSGRPRHNAHELETAIRRGRMDMSLAPMQGNSWHCIILACSLHPQCDAHPCISPSGATSRLQLLHALNPPRTLLTARRRGPGLLRVAHGGPGTARPAAGAGRRPGCLRLAGACSRRGLGAQLSALGRVTPTWGWQAAGSREKIAGRRRAAQHDCGALFRFAGRDLGWVRRRLEVWSGAACAGFGWALRFGVAAIWCCAG